MSIPLFIITKNPVVVKYLLFTTHDVITTTTNDFITTIVVLPLVSSDSTEHNRFITNTKRTRNREDFIRIVA